MKKMKKRILILVVVLSALTISINLSAKVDIINYRNWTNCYQIQNDSVSVIIVPEAGGRVLSYSLNNKSIIYKNSSLDGKKLSNWLSNWFDPDGGRFDLGPESETNENWTNDTLYMGAYTVEVTGKYSVTLTSKVDKSMGVYVIREFTLDSASSHLVVRQTVTNISHKQSHYYFWGRTLVNFGGTLILPLNKNSKYAKGWGDFRSSGSWKFNTVNPSLPYVSSHDSILTLKPTSGVQSNKFGVDATDGWIAYTYSDQLFVKRFKYLKNGSYKEPGAATIVAYTNGNSFTEIEPIGYEVLQNYLESSTFEEHWWLLSYPSSDNVHADPSKVAKFINTNTSLKDLGDRVVPSGNSAIKLSTNKNFQFLEGPVWFRDSILYFTDLGSSPQTINSYTPAGVFNVFKANSYGANGLFVYDSVHIVTCQTKGVVVLDMKGVETEVLADKYNGHAFNSPNDLVVAKNGGVYFTDPMFGATPAIKEAVYYVTPSGVLSQIIADMKKPNGIILSPDGKSLYVDDSEDKYVYVCDVLDNGGIANKRRFAELVVSDGSNSSVADGMTIDTLGNLYVTSAAGIQVFDKRGGYLTTIKVPERPSNCTFGGSNMKTLYITASKNLYSIDLLVPGIQSFINKNITAIGETKKNDKITVFPNPASTYIQVNTVEDIFTLEFQDLSGKTLFVKTIFNNYGKIGLPNLLSGLYLVKVTTKNDTSVSKIIIKR